MRRYAAASHFWRAVPVGLADWAWQRRGRLLLARVAREVPAYASLLRVFADPAASAEPLSLQTSGRSYVQVFPLEQRGRQGWQRQVVSFDPPGSPVAAADDIPRPPSPLASSRHAAFDAARSAVGADICECPPPSGAQHPPWPRARDELQALREHLVGVLTEWFDIARRRTLLIVALPEGGWASRSRISQALQSAVASSRLPVTVVELASPGTGADANSVQITPGRALQTVCRQAVGEQVVLLADPAGAATHAQDLAQILSRSGLMVLGQCPDSLAMALPPEVSVCSVLGAEEVGPLIASESHFSRLLLTLCRTNPTLARSLLPDVSVAGFYQPLPGGPWLEQADDRLLVTSWGAAPLARYRLGWSARLIPFERVCDALSRSGVLPSRQLKRFMRIGSSCRKLPLIAVLRG